MPRPCSALQVVSLLASLGCGQAAPARPVTPAPTADAWPEADALFHQDPRWLGSDVAYSVDLGEGRVLWLFGDTFVATSAPRTRDHATLVRNTVAIERGYDPSRASIAFRWRMAAGTPTPFFPGTEADWIWPGHGAVIDGCLVLFLSRVAPSSDALGFRADGWAAVRIDDPADDPALWRPVPLATPASTFGVTFGATAIAREGFLYSLGTDDESHAVYLARWPASAVARGDLSAPEWKTASGGWSPQSSLTALPEPLFADGSTELSVQPDPRGAGWIEVQARGFGASPLELRSARELEGPWGSPSLLYRPPECAKPGALVYAGKGHPELAGAELVLTYASNSASFVELRADSSLYYPRFVRVNWARRGP